MFSYYREDIGFQILPLKSIFLCDGDEVGAVEDSRDSGNLKELLREGTDCCEPNWAEVHGLRVVAGHWLARNEFKARRIRRGGGLDEKCAVSWFR